MNEKKKMNVRINGVEYTIISNENEDYVHKIAIFLDRKMNEISSANSRLSTAMVAVLAAINVADDFFKTTNDADSLKSQVLSYADELSKKTAMLLEAQKENEALKAQIQRLQIEIAKKDARLSN